VFRDFWHRPKVRAVTDVSFDIRRGEVFGLLRTNGSGKSTTLKMILGSCIRAGPAHRPRQFAARRKDQVTARYLPRSPTCTPTSTSDETLDFIRRLFDLRGDERRARMDSC